MERHYIIIIIPDSLKLIQKISIGYLTITGCCHILKLLYEWYH